MVEGAGDVFNNRGLKWYLIRRFVCHGYKKSFKYSKKVFFLNETDLNESEIAEYLTYKKLSMLSTIKNCIVVLTVSSIIGMVISIFI